MKVHFLGTGTSQGIPVIGSDHPVCLSNDPRDKRLRVSVWIEWEDCSLVIDCGPDFRQQMLASGCTRVDAIFYTHEHSDHTAGLDDIRPLNFRNGKMPLYAHPRVLANLRQRFDYVFQTENRYPGAPSVIPHEVQNGKNILFKGKEIVPVNVMHGDLQIFGYRIDDFAYLTDVKTISDEEMMKLKGVKTLVVNALRFEPHDMHFNLEEALSFISKVKPEKAFLTHISHLFGFHEEVQQQLPENVYLAYDNLEITT